VRPAIPRRRGARSPGGRSQRGQGLTEFALIVPVFTLLLLGMLEFGLAFNHYMTLEYGTREGARVASALANGGSGNCIAGTDLYAIDEQTIAAVQRLLKSPGSPVNLADISEIRTYRATSTGEQQGSQANVWRYTPGAGPLVDGARIDFTRTSHGWPVCSRNNATPNPDSVGVRINYSYRLSTPLGAIMRMLGGDQGATIPIVDRTVMALNPSH
jgi:Flp pilus assembly protein TadG